MKPNLTIGTPDIHFPKEVFSCSVIQNKKEPPGILLYGDITPWEKIDYADFRSRFETALNDSNEVVLRIHGSGGDVIEGFAVYDLLRTSNAKVTVIIEGKAADMFAIIALAGDEIKMTENAFWVFNASYGYATGQESVFINMAKQLERCDFRIKDILLKRSKVTEEEANKWLDPDETEKWISAEESIALHLCSSIIKSNKKAQIKDGYEVVDAFYIDEESGPVTVPVSAADELGGREDWSFKQWQENDPGGLQKLYTRFPETFKKLFNNQYGKNERNIEELLNERGKWSFSEWQNNDPEGLEKLNKSRPEVFKQLYNQHYNSSENIDEVLEARRDWTLEDWQKNDSEGLQKRHIYSPEIVKQLFSNQYSENKNVGDLLNERAEWSFSEWQKNDPEGLKKLNESDPEAFKRLFQQQYSNRENIEDLLQVRSNWTLEDWQKNDPEGLNILNEKYPEKVTELLNNKL